MRTDAFDYHLPPELIAQEPLPRGQSRLLLLHRADGRIEHRVFAELPEFLEPGDVLVLNDTRVTARRLAARRDNGLPAEVLLLRPCGEREWEALVRPGRRLRTGAHLDLNLADGSEVSAEVLGETPEGGRILRLPSALERDRLASEGLAPLPPYIHHTLADESRYQTVYAREGGSAAAPTAGLHFTEHMLDRIAAAGIALAHVTLHVGIDTFRPVRTDQLEEHHMHGERFSISEESAQRINGAAGRVIAVGTTVVRALESAADEAGVVRPVDNDETRLFITPGYRFKAVRGILTNFHLPKSTLVVLISAFAGTETVLAAYREAVRERYRFYSFGDAMLIV